MGVISTGEIKSRPRQTHHHSTLGTGRCQDISPGGTMVNDELSYTNVKMTYWVDSMIALGYILNDTKRFRTFVANKKKTINEYTEKKQWQYVDTASNPADHASRGITPAESDKVHSWLNGPSFLW